VAERELKVKFTGDTSGLNKAVGDAERSTSGAAGKIGAAGKAIAASFAVAGAAGVAFATKSIDTYKNVGGEVSKLKKFTGGTAEDASRLRAAFKLTGIDTDKAATAIGRFSKNLVTGKLDGYNTSLAGQQATAKKVQAAMDKLADAQKDHADAQAKLHDGTKVTAADLERVQKSSEKVTSAQEKLTNVSEGAGDAMGKLGFKTRDAQGHMLPMSQLLPKVADVFKEMPAGTEETALAMELFGKAGTDMLPFLNKGAEGIAELTKKSDELGTTMSGKDLDAIKESKEQSREWGLNMEALQIQIGRYLLPVLNDLMGWILQKGIPKFKELAKTVADWVLPKLTALHEWWDRSGKPALDGFLKWIGEKLIPKLQEIGAKIVDWVKPKLDAFADWWKDKGKPGWDAFIKWIDEKLIPKLEGFGGGAFGTFIDLVKSVGEWARKHPNWAKPIAAGIGAITLALSGFGVEFATSPLGLFILIITGLGTAFYTAYTNNEQFRNSVDGLIDHLQTAWGPIAESFQTDFLDPMKEKWDSFYNDFLVPLWNGISSFAGMASEAWSKELDTWSPILAGIFRGLQGVVSSVVMVLSSIWNGFTINFGNGVLRIQGVAETLKQIWNGLAAFARAVVSILSGIWNGFTLQFGGTALRIQGVAETLKQIWNGLAAAARFVVSILSGIWNGFTLQFGGTALRIQGFAETAGDAWKTMGQVIAGVAGVVAGIVTNFISGIEIAVGQIETLHQRIKDVGDWISRHSGGLIPNFSGPNHFYPIPAPEPPALASGGIIKGSPWGTLVRAGERNRSEAIIPLSKIPAAGNTYNITVDVAPGADPVRAGAAVVDAIRSYERVNGQRWRTEP
jgi:hypothetical protein